MLEHAQNRPLSPGEPSALLSAHPTRARKRTPRLTLSFFPAEEGLMSRMTDFTVLAHVLQVSSSTRPPTPVPPARRTPSNVRRPPSSPAKMASTPWATPASSQLPFSPPESSLAPSTSDLSWPGLLSPPAPRPKTLPSSAATRSAPLSLPVSSTLSLDRLFERCCCFRCSC